MHVADRHRAYDASAAKDSGKAGQRSRDGGAGLARRIDEHALEHLHILVIDDDETICEALAEALEQYGAHVASAPSAAAALERLTREHFDIACSDLEMTGGSGLSLARALRAREHDGQRLPLIAVRAPSAMSSRPPFARPASTRTPKPVDEAGAHASALRSRSLTSSGLSRTGSA
jgi:CheY-like chemotaxis protein